MDLVQNIDKGWEQWIPAIIQIAAFRCFQIPSCSNICPFHRIFQDSRHCRIHWPAHMKDFNQPVDMLQYMDISWEAKRIDLEQRHFFIICSIHLYVRITSKTILIFPLCRFDNHKLYSLFSSPDILPHQFL